MIKIKSKETILIAAIFFALFFNSQAHAATIISTTYNCAEQDQSTPGWVNCGSGPLVQGLWTTGLGSKEQITLAANYPGGGGGRGQRHWIGDGTNSTSGSIRYSVPTTKEIYVRWYVRWQSGLSLPSNNGSHKAIYFAGSGCGATANGCYFLLEKDRLRTTVGGYNFYDPSNNLGWNQLHGGTTTPTPSDGNWHCFEIHAKSETSTGASNGIAQWWIDGVLRHNTNSVSYKNTADGFNDFTLPSNGVFTTVGGADMYSDIDDVVVSTTGPIDCLGSTAPPPPPAPAPIAGDINLDHIVNSLDYSILSSQWFTANTQSDLNSDGLVNGIDFSILNSNWFKTW